MKLTLPVPPSANDWHRAVVMKNGSHVILTRKARIYTQEAQTAAMLQRVTKIRQPQEIIVSIRWYRAKKQGDVDKRGAVLLDALQGICYDNDSQIVRYTIERDDSDKDNPRMEISIEAAA